jgi:two-component system, chemotaxis family, chemotaxis protein CheY
MKHQQTVLVIDDSTYIRIATTKMLKEMEFDKIDTAENGKVGLDKFKLTHPQIVILDGVLPELDGLTVLKEMKKERPMTIVIVSSSVSARETIVEFKASGADNYLLKPYTKEKFNEAMTRAISLVEVA